MLSVALVFTMTLCFKRQSPLNSGAKFDQNTQDAQQTQAVWNQLTGAISKTKMLIGACENHLKCASLKDMIFRLYQLSARKAQAPPHHAKPEAVALGVHRWIILCFQGIASHWHGHGHSDCQHNHDFVCQSINYDDNVIVLKYDVVQHSTLPRFSLAPILPILPSSQPHALNRLYREVRDRQ